MFNRLAAGLLAGATLAAVAAPAKADTTRPVRWNTGGAIWTTTSSEFKTFFETGEITDRALAAGIANSGWTADCGSADRRSCTGFHSPQPER